MHTDLKDGYTMTANNCFAGADRDGYGHEEQGLMCERVLKIRYRDDFLSESFHGNGSIS